MKPKLAILGAILVLGLTALLDKSSNTSTDSMYYERDNEESVDADAQYVQRATSYSYEFLLDEMKEVNENIVETYREYQIHKDSDGNIISKIPTSNYQYLKYKKE
ncbi:hypothetical protein [Paucisalibacillus sp. EB02]|uniref:hypothetical protein n=1 Tax=Paucisalibacillus sp. EB02 TaxID=1347087 RepID=UPI0005A6DAF9|nr:hypothetical protein [Paucisalibacillus sp. EB02]